MKRLQIQTINILILILLSACVFGRDEYISIAVRKKPVINLDDEKVLALPIVLQSQDIRLDKDLYAYFLEVIRANKNNIDFLSPEKAFGEALNQARKYFKDKTFDAGLFHNYGTRYILLHHMTLDVEFYSSYSRDDQLNPAYSVESGGAPGLYETPTEWRDRSFEDLVIKANSRLVVYDTETGGEVMDKTIENMYVLEDYRYKDVSGESKKIFYLLTQGNAELFLEYFREREEWNKRVYLK